MDKTVYNLIVIGSGPAGYVAAVRASQLGMNVAIIEKRKSLGGTCLNVGCIPSKALLDSSEHYHQAAHKFDVHGIQIESLSVNWQQMLKRKQDVVKTTIQGIDFLMKKNKITVFNGTASFINKTQLCITEGKTKQTITGEKILIASGSEVTPLPSVPLDGKRIISSTEALALPKIPKSMVVIGGGVIGVELGSVYARLGTEVTVVEYLDGLIPTMDRDLGKALARSLKGVGFKYHFKTKVTSANSHKEKVVIQAETHKGEMLTLESEYVLVAIGRRPYTEGLGLEKIGLETNRFGQLEVNVDFQTNCEGVYAIGDLIPGPMLAHKASEEGVVCVERMAGHAAHLNYNTIPGVVYTWPEVASVGDTEAQLKDKGIAYKAGKFPFKASGRARASEETDGFVKVLADKQTDEVLGVHMIGPRVADLIAEACLAIEYRASAEDIAIVPHPHPTFSEAFKEAALAATDNRPIHL